MRKQSKVRPGQLRGDKKNRYVEREQTRFGQLTTAGIPTTIRTVKIADNLWTAIQKRHKDFGMTQVLYVNAMLAKGMELKIEGLNSRSRD